MEREVAYMPRYPLFARKSDVSEKLNFGLSEKLDLAAAEMNRITRHA